MNKQNAGPFTEPGRGDPADLHKADSAKAQPNGNTETAGAVSIAVEPGLTDAESREFKTLVARFRKLDEAWFEATAILLEIRSRKLYRASHETFEGFCREEFGMTRANVNRRIQCGEVAARLETIVAKPKEAHMRPLLLLKDDLEQQKLCLRNAVDAAAGKNRPMTAADVAAAVRAVLPPPSTSVGTPSAEQSRNDILTRLSRGVIRGLEAYSVTDLIQFEKEFGWFQRDWFESHGAPPAETGITGDAPFQQDSVSVSIPNNTDAYSEDE